MRLSRLAPLVVVGLVAPLAAAVPAAVGDDTPPPERVTVMGTVQDESGCDTDWSESCEATDMTVSAGGWELVTTLPAGSYEWKVRLNGSWTENYGVGGVADGPNLMFSVAGETELRFTYDHGSHEIAVAPTRAPEPLGDGDAALARDSLRDALTRERFYFVMADRFANGDKANDDAGLGPDRLVSGYDPTDTAFYHGGDLDGVIDKLDYIQGLGTTAIWLTPSFKNKPVQGPPGSEAAGYHGYWITDFTRIDPHLGSNADMRRLVRLAHQRDIKVFFDIITNHTADVVDYDREAYAGGETLPYVPTEEEPYRDAAGNPFDDREYADGEPAFPEVDLNSFPYTPVVPEAERDVKVPAWLNDPTLYHNRGTSTFAGESNTYGDFPSGPYSALDDLWTEHPRVVDGMVDIYQQWVSDVGIDGFRIDTVKHVNTEFWQQFSPALQDYARSVGNKDFFMFGEVYDASSKFVSQYTTEGRLQAAADFGFQANAAGFVKGGSAQGLAGFYAEDDWYTDTDSNAYQLPTFLGNHDMGRIGSFLRDDAAGWGERNLLRRDKLAHSLMYLTRGQPVVYYGDEQGFSAPKGVTGGFGDQRAREDMFPSRVELYKGYDLIGSDDSVGQSNFKTDRPLYRHLAELAALRQRHRTLADGAQVPRYAGDGPGVFAVSRIDADRQREYVVAVNNATTAQRVRFRTDTPSADFKRVWSSAKQGGQATARSGRAGMVEVKVPRLGAVVLRAGEDVPGDRIAPRPTITTPADDGTVAGRAEIGVDLRSNTFSQVTVAWRRVGQERWRRLGTDDNAPFRVFHDVRGLPLGTLVEYRVVAEDADGQLGVDQVGAMVAEDTGDQVPVTWGGPVTQPSTVSVPGQFQDEVGCDAEWAPTCEAVDLSLDASGTVWTRTFDGDQLIPAGGYGHKVAVDARLNADPWTENYGVGGVPNGDNISLTADGGPVTFWYSHATHWLTNSVETPQLFTLTGDLQQELGCTADGDRSCLATWLQDPDGDGVWTFRNHTLPAGTYTARVALALGDDAGSWGEGGSAAGADLTWTVTAGEGVEVSFTPPDPADPSSQAPLLEVSVYQAPPAG